MQLRLRTRAGELLDAAEDIRRLIDRDDELAPPLRDLLLALDDAITREFSHDGRRPAAA